MTNIIQKMVRNYVKKGLRQTWSDDSMRTAIDAVINKGLSIKRSCKINKVPHATLSRKVNQCRLDPERQNELLANPKSTNLKTVFNKEQEKILCNYISELESSMVGLTGRDVRRMAYRLADKLKIPHRFKKDIGIAGHDWYKGFLKRNPHVKVKRSESHYEKSRVFTKEKTYKFFDSLGSLLNKYDLKPADLYNLDETVITCWSKSSQSSKEKNVTEDDGQSRLVTAVISFSASGVYAPLLMVFPENEPLLHGAPLAVWPLVNSSGQMQLDIFIQWLKKFIDFQKPTISEPVVLIIDRYHEYLKDLEVLEIMTENGVHMLCLPPHCASKLQPSKHQFMDLLSKAYKNEVENVTKSSSEQSVPVDKVFKLFGDAFMKVSTTTIAENSFLNTGIWPPNRDLFKDEFIVDTLIKPSSVMNDSQSTSESSVFGADEEYQPVESNVPNVDQISVSQEPMIVISESHNQSCEMQETNYTNQSYNHSAELGHFLQTQNDPLEDVIHTRNDQLSEGAIVIPSEAQLTQVQPQDLQFLAQSQRKLYFYVSPYNLKLS